MTRNIIRGAKNRISELEQDRAENFDSPIVHNRVAEAIGQDETLQHVVDVAERAYAIEANEEQKHITEAAFVAAEELNDEVDTIVETVIAEECAAIIEDADDGWFDDVDHHAEDEIETAVTEASKWLFEHDEARERADVEYGAESQEVKVDA